MHVARLWGEDSHKRYNCSAVNTSILNSLNSCEFFASTVTVRRAIDSEVGWGVEPENENPKRGRAEIYGFSDPSITLLHRELGVYREVRQAREVSECVPAYFIRVTAPTIPYQFHMCGILENVIGEMHCIDWKYVADDGDPAWGELRGSDEVSKVPIVTFGPL
jgi:hypothetical protein